jgi:ribosomal 30S subunit maturation factor RimM
MNAAPTPTATTPAGWVALGVITQPHGVSGRVKVKPFTEPAENFKRYKSLTDTRGNEMRFRVTGEAQSQYIIEIEGVTRREAAEALRGLQLGIACACRWNIHGSLRLRGRLRGACGARAAGAL